MRDLSLHQTIVAVAGLVGVTVLAALGVVTPETVIAIYSLVLGSAVGYINGKKSGMNHSDLGDAVDGVAHAITEASK